MDFSLLETIALYAVPVVLAITLHEAAHGYVARMFGDQTAWMLGRVTLNPVKHIDPVGTVAVPAILLLVGSPFIFGWAKPVPVNFGNLRNPKQDMLWVAGAGPVVNFLMAIAWALLLKDSAPDAALASNGLHLMASAGVQINLMLMALNLLPILPLDGGRILVSLLPHKLAVSYAQTERYGLLIVVGLLMLNHQLGILDALMRPILRAAEYVISGLVGL
jgi:Zn-dependent protease